MAEDVAEDVEQVVVLGWRLGDGFKTDPAAALGDVVDDLGRMRKLLLPLDAKPTRGTLQVVLVRPGRHREVDVRGGELAVDLIVEGILDSLRDTGHGGGSFGCDFRTKRYH